MEYDIPETDEEKREMLRTVQEMYGVDSFSVPQEGGEGVLTVTDVADIPEQHLTSILELLLNVVKDSTPKPVVVPINPQLGEDYTISDESGNYCIGKLPLKRPTIDPALLALLQKPVKLVLKRTADGWPYGLLIQGKETVMLATADFVSYTLRMATMLLDALGIEYVIEETEDKNDPSKPILLTVHDEDDDAA